MTDFPGFIENAMTGDNVEGSQRDEYFSLCSHWHRICAAGIASVSAGCTAWLQLAAAVVVLNSNDVGIVIKDNPASSSLQGKSCQHWDIMNTLWSSSRAVGINSSTVRERSGRIQHQFESMSRDAPTQSTNNQNSSVNCAGSSADHLPTETLDQAIPDASDSQPLAGSGKTKRKRKATSDSQPSAGSGKTKRQRKATADVILQSVGKNIATSLDNVSRAIIESAEILAKKMLCPYDPSEELFTSLQALELSQEYLIECYDFLTEHEAAANKFLGVSQQFRKKMLTRIMIAASLSKKD